MKKHHIIFFVTLIAQALLFTSCTGIRSEIELFRSEFDGIAEFFAVTVPTDISDTSPAVLEDTSDIPILKTERHRENLPSVYSSAIDYAEIAESDKLGYTEILHFSSNDVDTVKSELTASGISVQIITRRNPAPANHVYSVEFAGLSNDTAYYINPSVPVTLYVSAEKPSFAERADDNSNVVYLTYDDGPTYAETIRLLDVLDSYGVKATFFVTGEAVQKYPSSARAITERGHTLGCHSVTHVYENIYSSAESLENELILWEDIVSGAGIELDSKLFRYPGGSNNSAIGDTELAREMTEMLEDHSYRIYDWNVVTNDAVLYTAPDGTDTYDYLRETFLSTFEAKIAGGGVPIIILMHETVPETIDLMPWVIETLIERGYTFDTLDTIDSWTFG